MVRRRLPTSSSCPSVLDGPEVRGLQPGAPESLRLGVGQQPPRQGASDAASTGVRFDIHAFDLGEGEGEVDRQQRANPDDLGGRLGGQQTATGAEQRGQLGAERVVVLLDHRLRVVERHAVGGGHLLDAPPQVPVQQRLGRRPGRATDTILISLIVRPAPAGAPGAWPAPRASGRPASAAPSRAGGPSRGRRGWPSARSPADQRRGTSGSA